MQDPDSLKCTVCGETFRSFNAMQQHVGQTRHMESQMARQIEATGRHEIIDRYRVEGSESSWYCKPCQKAFTSVSAVLQHEKAKHEKVQPKFYKRCTHCNDEQNTAFGWLNHRGDCKKVPMDIRYRIKVTGFKCLAAPGACSAQCMGLGIILHLNDQHGVDLNYFEDDFAAHLATVTLPGRLKT